MAEVGLSQVSIFMDGAMEEFEPGYNVVLLC